MTIKEIAEMASVSTGTVDRVIHNRGYVDANKRAHIEQIIKENNFKPNIYARNLKLNKILKVGYLTPFLTSEDGYWELVYHGVLKAQEDLMDHSFVVEKYEYDRNTAGDFTKKCERMLESGITTCVIIPKCIEEARTFIFHHPEIHFVLVDSIVPNATPICMIGQNPYRGGQLAGRILSMLIPDAKNILTFSFKNSYISKERIRGFRKYYERYNSCNIIELNLETVADIPVMLKAAYTKYGIIDGIFSPCSAGHFWGNEVAYLGHTADTKIITYDLIPENRHALIQGTIDCILSQRPVFQGYAGIFQLYRHLILKQEIDKFIEVQVDILFQENLPESYDKNCIGKLNQYCIPIR